MPLLIVILAEIAGAVIGVTYWGWFAGIIGGMVLGTLAGLIILALILGPEPVAPASPPGDDTLG